MKSTTTIPNFNAAAPAEATVYCPHGNARTERRHLREDARTICNGIVTHKGEDEDHDDHDRRADEHCQRHVVARVKTRRGERKALEDVKLEQIQ